MENDKIVEEVKTESDDVVYTKPEDITADQEEKDTPTESSPDEKTEEVVEEEAKAEESPKEDAEVKAETTEPPIEDPKPVEGETPRERGLRRDNELLRERLRVGQKDELFKKVESTTQLDDEVLKEYDPEEVTKLEKLIGKLGYVKKAELESQSYESQANEQLSTFLEKHTEYLPENDKDGVLWKQFKTLYGELNAQPKNPKDYNKIFNAIHTGLSGSSSIDIKKINASKEKIKVASHSGASMTGKQPIRRSQDPTIRRDGLKGFEDSELDDLLS